MSIRKEIRKQIKKIILEKYLPGDVMTTGFGDSFSPPAAETKTTAQAGEKKSTSQYQFNQPKSDIIGPDGETLRDGKKEFIKKENVNDQFLKEVLRKVISVNGKRKDFNDHTGMDGGTVGIAHWAAGGLGGLYEAMGDANVKKFFGKYNNKIDAVDKIKSATKIGNTYCRITYNKHPDDCATNSKFEWWRKGMVDFLNDKQMQEMQANMWLESHGRKARDAALSYASSKPVWGTKRGVALVCCFMNSGGLKGVKKWTKNGTLNVNDSMNNYVRDIKKVRVRLQAINILYPDPNFRGASEKGIKYTYIWNYKNLEDIPNIGQASRKGWVDPPKKNK